MYRAIAPWVTENPITHHLLTNKPELAREAIDKASDVGFEAIIFSFGSGFNMENRDPDFLAEWKDVADYARTKNIELGSYSLLSSRSVAKEHMLVPPNGQEATHGRMPALTSNWGQAWIETVRKFYASTPSSMFASRRPTTRCVDFAPEKRWISGSGSGSESLSGFSPARACSDRKAHTLLMLQLVSSACTTAALANSVQRVSNSDSHARAS
jgi:hypothetical protein